MRPLHRFIVVLLSLAPATQAVCGKNYICPSPAQFAEIAAALSPGDTVTIPDGTYTDWSLVVAAQGTAEKPISLRAETTGGVVFNGTVTKPVFQITGSHIELKGFVFKDCVVDRGDGKTGVLIELQNATACRITESRFVANRAAVQWTPLVVVSGNGNTVDRCHFVGNLDTQDIKVTITRASVPVDNTIEHNLFQDKPPVTWPNRNGGECIQVGQDPVLLGNRESRTTVRHNRFIRCRAEPEIISNKSSRNTYAENYFEGCAGELVIRGGHDCIVRSNTFKNGGAIRVSGTGHIIQNNTVIGAKTGLRLMAGMVGGRHDTGFYVAAGDCVATGNQFEACETGILVGADLGRDWTGKFDVNRYPSPTIQNVAPFNLHLADNRFVSTKTEVVVAE